MGHHFVGVYFHVNPPFSDEPKDPIWRSPCPRRATRSSKSQKAKANFATPVLWRCRLILIRDVMMIDHRFLGKKPVSDIPRCSFLWLYLSQTMLRYIWGTSWLGRKCFKYHKYDPRSSYQSQWFFLPWGKSTANLDLPRLSFLAGYPKTSLTSHSTGVTDQGIREADSGIHWACLLHPVQQP